MLLMRPVNTRNFAVNVIIIIPSNFLSTPLPRWWSKTLQFLNLLRLPIWSKNLTVKKAPYPLTFRKSSLIHWFLELGRNPPRDQTTFQDEYLIAFPSESLVIGVVHQIVSPISNPKSTNFINKYKLIKISFSTGKMRKKNTNKKFVFFLTA